MSKSHRIVLYQIYLYGNWIGIGKAKCQDRVLHNARYMFYCKTIKLQFIWKLQYGHQTLNINSKYFQYILLTFPISSVKIYCSHCPVGAASLMDSIAHWFHFREKGKCQYWQKYDPSNTNTNVHSENTSVVSDLKTLKSHIARQYLDICVGWLEFHE